MYSVVWATLEDDETTSFVGDFDGDGVLDLGTFGSTTRHWRVNSIDLA